MSMDAGGLAHMTYHSNNGFPSTNNGLGVPGSGFASRGKGGHIKRLSVAPPPKINSIYEDEVDANPPPRTSRSHLLAGLRTAPRGSAGVPSSAPFSQTQHRFDGPTVGDRGNTRLHRDMPQTAMSSHFPGVGQNQYHPGVAQHMYCSPDQVLAPPDLNIGNGHDEHMDPELYNDLMVQNLYLLQRQQQLQQQLVNVTAAAQQFQGLNLNQGHHAPATPVTPHMSLYNQQLQNGVQPVISPIPNQPGVYTVYNPMTGQQTIYYDQSAQNMQMAGSPPLGTPGYGTSSPEADIPNYFRRDNMSPPNFAGSKPRTITPPKSSPSPPQDVKPLPTPSSNAFRPGHRKSMSNALSNGAKSAGLDGPKASMPRSAGIQPTPTTGTFGLGMGRAGEHPIRQPRGPPPLEELVASPTSKHEGSKNFATRQRRRAVHNLVRAGNERRSGRSGSADAGTPGSETDLSFAVSDADSEGSGSGISSGSSGKSSLSAIGSEWKELKERSRDRTLVSRAHAAGSSFSGSINGNNSGSVADSKPDFAAAVKGEDHMTAFQRESERRKTPLLVLTSAAEKRKTSAV